MIQVLKRKLKVIYFIFQLNDYKYNIVKSEFKWVWLKPGVHVILDESGINLLSEKMMIYDILIYLLFMFELCISFLHLSTLPKVTLLHFVLCNYQAAKLTFFQDLLYNTPSRYLLILSTVWFLYWFYYFFPCQLKILVLVWQYAFLF